MIKDGIHLAVHCGLGLSEGGMVQRKGGLVLGKGSLALSQS